MLGLLPCEVEGARPLHGVPAGRDAQVAVQHHDAVAHAGLVGQTYRFVERRLAVLASAAAENDSVGGSKVGRRVRAVRVAGGEQFELAGHGFTSAVAARCWVMSRSASVIASDLWGAIHSPKLPSGPHRYQPVSW